MRLQKKAIEVRVESSKPLVKSLDENSRKEAIENLESSGKTSYSKRDQ